MANLLKLMQAAKEMQKNVESTQKKLEKTSIVGEDQGVKIIANGQHSCLDVSLAAEVKDLPLENIAKAIKNAINQINEQIKSLSQSEFSNLAEQMKLNDDK